MKQLSRTTVRRYVSSEDPAKRAYIASHKGWTPTPVEAERGLWDVDAYVRHCWLERQDVRWERAWVDRLLQDDKRHVRIACIGNVDAWTPTPADWEAGLSDPDDPIRGAWFRRPDLPKSVETVDRMSKDPRAEIRRHLAAGRLFASWLSADALERLLTDPDVRVRCAIAEFYPEPLAPSAIERGLADENRDVRIAYISLSTWYATPDVISRGFERASGDIDEIRGWRVSTAIDEIRAWVGRSDFVAPPGQLDALLNSPDVATRMLMANCRTFEPTSDQALRGLSDVESGVRVNWRARRDYQVTPEHFAAVEACREEIPCHWWWRMAAWPRPVKLTSVMKATMGDSPNLDQRSIRLAIASQFNGPATPLQFQIGVADHIPLVRYLWCTRAD